MRMKTMISELLACLMALLSFFPVMGVRAEDFASTGSLTITMHYEDKAVGGGQLTIYQVGTISNEDGDPGFELTGEFKDSKIPLTNPENQTVLDALLEYAEKNDIAGIVRTIPSNGTVTLDPVSTGLYLITQTKAASGYETMSPFLISVPLYDEESGKYLYDVDCYPKSEVKPSTIPGTTTTNTTTTTTKPTTNTNNTNTGLNEAWYGYLGILLLCLLFVFLYMAGSLKKRT